jgi:hypothetical protein
LTDTPDNDDAPDEAPEESASDPSPPGASDGKRFRAATPEELDPQSFMIANERSALRAVLRGGSIGDDRGDAEFIGGAIRRLARSLHKSAEHFRGGTGSISSPLLKNLAWTSSVVLEFEIGESEDVQMDIDGRRHAPLIDAAYAITELLAADANDLVSQALTLGPEAAAAHKRFLNLLGEENVTVELQPAGSDRVVTVTSNDARRDWAILDREGEKQSGVVEVPGTLTMADSELKQFALTLPPELGRPPLLKGKHRIRGTYADELAGRLKDEGLWDSEVMATIEVSYDEPGTSPIPRDPTYRLIAAEPLVPPTPPPSLFE